MENLAFKLYAMKKETIDLFDQYLSGELSGQERAAFEARLEASDELQREFRIFKTSVEALLEFPAYADSENAAGKLRAEALAAMAGQFEKYRSGAMNDQETQAFEKLLEEEPLLAYQYKKSQSQGRILPLRPSLLKMAVAASVLIAAVLLGWLIFHDRVDAGQLYASHNLPELVPSKEIALVNEGLIHRGIEGSRDFHQLRLDGLDAYEAKDWDRAISLLTQYIEQAIPDTEETVNEIKMVYLYIGVAWLEKSDAKKAIEAFLAAEEGITDQTNYRMIRELVQWQLALAYLKKGDVSASKAVLKKLNAAEHPLIQEQAKNLLNELK